MALSVVSYNIQEGGQNRLSAIGEVILSARPDVCALLEANDHAAVESLASRLGMELVYGEGNCPAHVAWLSRLPVLRACNHRLPELQKTLLQIEIEHAGRRLSLFAAHLAAGREAGEDAVAWREKEVHAILGELYSAEEPHLLAGDLNSLHPEDRTDARPAAIAPRGDAVPGAPRRIIRALLDAGYTDCFRALHPHDPGYTYPTERPWLRLDYTFASPDLSRHLTACDVLDMPEARCASDHLPVRAEFAWDARPFTGV